MQTTGHGVPAAAELAARVQDGEDDLDGWATLAGHDVDGDAAAVVDHPHPTVGEQRHVDGVAVAASASSTELSTIS